MITAHQSRLSSHRETDNAHTADSGVQLGALLEALPIYRYRLRVRATEPMRFSEYSGSAWRGLFGHQLKRAACVTRKPQCQGCMLQQRCVYSVSFEAPLPESSQIMRKYTSVPRPFILKPDPECRQLERGQHTEIRFTLIGHQAQQQLPYYLHAFEQGQQSTIGQGGRYQLVGLWQESILGTEHWQLISQDQQLKPLPYQVPPLPPMPKGPITLSLETPLRIRYQRALMDQHSFELAGLLSNTLRRLSSLAHFYGDPSLSDALDFKALSQAARQVPLEKSALRWQNGTRYSSRQQSTVNLSGLVGQLTLAPEHLGPFWPLLWLGQYLHSGKSTCMGLGAYAIHTPDSNEY